MNWKEENTRPNLLRPSLVQRSESTPSDPPPDDDDSLIGKLMRQTVRNTQAIQSMGTELSTLSREVRQHQRGIDDDRPILANRSARHASNRLAVMMGALFTMYEVTAPYVREIWRQWVHR